MAALQEIAWTSLLLLLFIGSLAGLAMGIGLTVRSEATLRFFNTMNRWVSSRAAMKPMEYMASKVRPGNHHAWPAVRNAAINNVYSGNRAEQLMSGATRIVASRSRRFSMTRGRVTRIRR